MGLTMADVNLSSVPTALTNAAQLVIEGRLHRMVTLQDGRKKRLKAGDLLAEVVDVAHTGRNVGSGVVKLVVFYAGAKGVTLTEKLDHR